MVIGDDHGHAQFTGIGHRLKGSDAVIDGQNNADPVAIKGFDNPGIQPIALLHAAGDGVVGIGSQKAQGPDQQGGAGHAVGVVVATDGNFLALGDRLHQNRHAGGQVGNSSIGEGNRAARVLETQPPARGLRCRDLAKPGLVGVIVRWLGRAPALHL
jgi:hypothetical protein